MKYCEECMMSVSDTVHTYENYAARVEADNLARDMYDGDTYMGYEDLMTRVEWDKSHKGERR